MSLDSKRRWSLLSMKLSKLLTDGCDRPDGWWREIEQNIHQQQGQGNDQIPTPIYMNAFDCWPLALVGKCPSVLGESIRG